MQIKNIHAEQYVHDPKILPSRSYVSIQGRGKLVIYLPHRSWSPTGISAGSSIYYTVHTADLPYSNDTVTATYPDDMALLSSHKDPNIVCKTSRTLR